MDRIVKIDPASPEQALARCKKVIVSGGVIVYPTDTFYGLGADPRNAAAVNRLFEIKGRPAGQPILLLISDPALVGEWAREIPPAAARLIKEFWPGPLTLVFKAKPDVLPQLTGGTGTIGLRMPGSRLTRQLLAYLGSPLTGTSANKTGERSPDTSEEAASAMGGIVDLVLDGGRTAGGRPSTIVDVASENAKLIREGSISFQMLADRL